MEDSTTDTEQGSGGDDTPAPRKVGQAPSNTDMSPEDAALFEKHFGGLDDGEPEGKPKPKAKEPKAAPKDGKAPKAKDEPAPKVEKEPEPDTEDQPDEPDEPNEPEAQATKKARELFEKAEKSKNPVEARRLYKQAMREAFGKVPEAFNDARYAAARQADRAREAEHAKKDAELEEKATNVETSAKKWVEQLRPAYHVMDALRKVANGDWGALGDVIERAAPGVTRDEAIKRFVKGIKETPEQVHARRNSQRQQQVESDALRRVAELEKKLEEKDKAKENEARRARAAAKREAYQSELTEELADHPVSKLPGGVVRVLKLLVKTADPKLRTPTKTPEQAADIIYALEKRRLKALRAAIPDDGESPRAPATREDTRAPAIPRSQTTHAGGVVPYDPDAAFDKLWSKHNPPKARRR